MPGFIAGDLVIVAVPAPLEPLDVLMLDGYLAFALKGVVERAHRQHQQRHGQGQAQQARASQGAHNEQQRITR